MQIRHRSRKPGAGSARHRFFGRPLAGLTAILLLSLVGCTGGDGRHRHSINGYHPGHTDSYGDPHWGNGHKRCTK